ncbi:4-hydroxyphenylpyruvate dioxygenase [Streptomyces sp. NPDC018045]|uniref:4-hydroxyphenylpyruvate dioxygenase n=1 Tax=Streptomyces sp. NPDC018045 TaxID=3365037 RepID=UPI0037B655A1
MTSTGSPLEHLGLDHVRLMVADLDAATRWLADGYGFAVHARDAGHPRAVRSVGLGSGDIRLVLSQPLAADTAPAAFVERHGDAVADIALRVDDAGAAFGLAVSRGARPVAEPARRGDVTTAAIEGIGDLVHTFVERPPGHDPRTLPGLVPTPAAPGGCGLAALDHMAVCVPPGRIRAATEFYRDVLGFGLIFTERLAVGGQGMTTEVVQSPSGEVTLTLIEPDAALPRSHVDAFVEDHGGIGVQHIAFSTDDIVRTVAGLASRGVRFMGTPDSYYDGLASRLTLARHRETDLRRHRILVDQDHDGQLFQIFARSVHPRNTLFLEVIERLGARSFGSGNIKALYRAAEAERAGIPGAAR